ncbi:MAG: thermonuclease family protein [Gammaproteobacteria bacterium]|nr:thermonuclease family protein [Gammaproteobacteria bacterium]
MLHGKCRLGKKASWYGAFFVCALLLHGIVHARTEGLCASGHIDEWAQVGEIIDGDTLRLTDKRSIRFIAINAPELAHDGQAAQPLAQAATEALRSLLPEGSRVGLRYGQDRYDHHHRVLAHVFDQAGRNISAILLRQGYAFAIAIPPNLWQSSCYFQAENQARADGLGVWSLRYYRPKPAQQLRIREGGFYRVTGRVEHIGNSRRSVWLDMSKTFAVRIPRAQLKNFSTLSIEGLLNKEITVRGWARFYNHKLNMTLTHPAMIESRQ